MSDTYDHEREFRLKILALCLDDSWMARFGDAIIKPNYFSRDDEVAFADAVIKYRAKFSHSPLDPHDVISLCKGEFSTFILDLYEIYEEHDFELAADVAIIFAREQAAKLAILDSVDDVKAGRISKAIERMQSALKVGEDLASSGIDPIADVDKWLYDYWSSKVRTGMYHVDRSLEGGLSPQELGIVLASTNKGKSMALVNIGFGAATIGSGVNVIHFFHEGRQEQIAKRYAARILFRFPSPDADLEDYAEDLIDKARKFLVGKIRIIGGKDKTTSSIESHIERLIADDYEPGLIIDDYLDLVESPRQYTERRFECSATYEWFKNLCEKYNLPGWSASQAGRQALSKEMVTVADIAEDIGKANIADVIVALCQTYDEEQVDQCRLYMAKVRDSKSKALINAKFYGSSQAIVTTGYVSPKKDEQSV